MAIGGDQGDSLCGEIAGDETMPRACSGTLAAAEPAYIGSGGRLPAVTAARFQRGGGGRLPARRRSVTSGGRWRRWSLARRKRKYFFRESIGLTSGAIVHLSK
jgi:hypothetical protein